MVYNFLIVQVFVYVCFIHWFIELKRFGIQVTFNSFVTFARLHYPEIVELP